MKWLKNLLSNSNEASHKRFIAVFSWIILIVVIGIYIVLVALEKKTDNTILYILAALTGGESAATVIDKVIKPNNTANNEIKVQ